jgi:hypothetical protein
MRTLILIPNRTGWFSAHYKIARKAIKGTNAILTSSLKEALLLTAGSYAWRSKYCVTRVIIIQGSPRLSAFYRYQQLKKINSNIRFIVMDSWSWKLRKSDRMILLPGNMAKTIRKYSK